MCTWRDPHHADAAAYEEFRKKARWAERTKDWLRNAPHLWLQWLWDMLHEFDDLDEDGLDPSLVDNNLPHRLHLRDDEQPDAQRLGARIVTSVPKKSGPKLEVNFRDNVYPEAWGLEFEEKFRVHRLLFYILILYALGSLATMATLASLYGLKLPTSMGVVVSLVGWVISLLSLLCAVWFKWAENL
ncbi:Uncharacterized protein HZ326_31773 [Fusarium oxysporum f. sp. albedinis]|nr:Uncharacterized protein HZ326_31773 [Fusarium oxysporum f. sp. albedinis]KAK2469011.1 hypothetical protein H9L39_19405 [Fusarium oxysporum f. sp. albedinis]